MHGPGNTRVLPFFLSFSRRFIRVDQAAKMVAFTVAAPLINIAAAALFAGAGVPSTPHLTLIGEDANPNRSIFYLILNTIYRCAQRALAADPQDAERQGEPLPERSERRLQ